MALEDLMSAPGTSGLSVAGEMGSEELVALQKALTAGYGSDTNGLTGGSAFRIQSLDTTLKATVQENKHFALFNALAKPKATAKKAEEKPATAQQISETPEDRKEAEAEAEAEAAACKVSVTRKVEPVPTSLSRLIAPSMVPRSGIFSKNRLQTPDAVPLIRPSPLVIPSMVPSHAPEKNPDTAPRSRGACIVTFTVSSSKT